MVSLHTEHVDVDRMRVQIRQIEWLDDERFHNLEYGVVAHYRRHPDDQEWIALELTRKSISARGPVARKRVGEILAMLEHVHDPLISASDETAPLNAPRRSDRSLYPVRPDRHSSQGQ